MTQSRKFDPAGRFIRRYLPQLAALPDEAIHAPWLADRADLAAAGVRLGENYRSRSWTTRARTRTLARFGRAARRALLGAERGTAAGWRRVGQVV